MSETTNDYFVSTISALILTIVVGAVSMISSWIIIYIIYKSESNLSTTYHRIMCGMSVADVIKCTAMILTTLPMPRELPEDEIDHGWKGARLGNMGTCQAQGFIVSFGMFSIYAYYVSLITFYTLKLGCQVQEGTITRCFEPFFHLVPIIIALGVSTRNIQQDSYHPNGMHTFCSPNTSDTGKSLRRFVTFIGVLFGYTLICFIVIIIRVRRNHSNAAPNIIRHGGNYHEEPVHNESAAVTPSFSPTQVILIQASAYVAAFVLTLVLPLFGLFSPENFWLHGIALLFFYSQGIFNLLIFVSHKVYNYRRINQNKGISEVILMLFCGEAHDDIYISRMVFVDRDINDVRLQRKDDEELMERIQFEDDSISIENNHDGERRDANNYGLVLASIPLPPIQETNEVQKKLDDSVIVCLDNDEEERSNDFGSQLHSLSSMISTKNNNTNLNDGGYSED